MWASLRICSLNLTEAQTRRKQPPKALSCARFLEISRFRQYPHRGIDQKAPKDTPIQSGRQSQAQDRVSHPKWLCG